MPVQCNPILSHWLLVMVEYYNKYMNSDFPKNSWQMSFILKIAFKICLFLFKRHSYREQEREREKRTERERVGVIFCLPVHCSNDCKGWGSSRPKLEPGASSRSATWVQGPSTRAMLCCFTRHMSRKFDRKWSGAARAWTGTHLDASVVGGGLAHYTIVPAWTMNFIKLEHKLEPTYQGFSSSSGCVSPKLMLRKTLRKIIFLTFLLHSII